MLTLDAFNPGPAEVQCEPYSPWLWLTPGYSFLHFMFLEYSLFMLKSCAYSDTFYLQDPNAFWCCCDGLNLERNYWSFQLLVDLKIIVLTNHLRGTHIVHKWSINRLVCKMLIAIYKSTKSLLQMNYFVKPTVQSSVTRHLLLTKIKLHILTFKKDC